MDRQRFMTIRTWVLVMVAARRLSGVTAEMERAAYDQPKLYRFKSVEAFMAFFCGPDWRTSLKSDEGADDWGTDLAVE